MTSFIRRIKTLKESNHLTSGQAIVLIGAASIGLIAMMGLAIDGGRLLFLQRDTQNAADAAAVAAARALCTARDPEPYALAAAEMNGFDNNQVDNWVDVYSPPANAAFEFTEECEGCYVEVTVKGSIPPTFIGLVYGGELAATSHAIGTCNPDLNGGAGAAPELRAMWAMGESCTPNSIEVSGSDIYISGGAHSNGQAKIMPSTGGGTVVGATSVVSASGDEVVQGEDKVTWSLGDMGGSDSGTTSTGTCLGSCFTDDLGGGGDTPPADGKPYVTDKKDEYPLDHDIADFQQPDGTEAKAAKAKGEYYQFGCSGKFYDWVIDNHLSDTNAMDNGIYYAECDIVINKLDDVTGNVTIVSTGTIDVSGDGQQWEPYTQNLLLFSTANEGCKNAIKFSGNDNAWTGNIFAPNGGIQMSASKNHTSHGCLVGMAVQISGSNNQVICNTETSETETEPGIWLSE